MANNLDLSKLSVSDLLAALEARKEEVTKDTTAVARMKSITKGVSSPREKSNQALRALLGNATKEIREAVTSAVTGNVAMSIGFLVDKWGDDTSIVIEIKSIAGAAPAGKVFRSEDGKLYPSRHVYMRTAVHAPLTASYAKSQTGDKLTLVDIPAAVATPAKK